MRIERGNLVTIASQGLRLTGVVRSASNLGCEDAPDWYIEFDIDGVRRHWKQTIDGGQIVTSRVLTTHERRCELALAISRVPVHERLLASEAYRLLRILRGYRATVADYVWLTEQSESVILSVEAMQWQPTLHQLRQLFSEPLSAALRNTC